MTRTFVEALITEGADDEDTSLGFSLDVDGETAPLSKPFKMESDV